MLPQNDQTINQLRQEKPTACKEIFGGNWAHFREAGWRHESDHDTGYMHNTLEYFRSLQSRHGMINVTIGQAWDTEKMMPQPRDKVVGFYIRDVEAEVQRLLRELDNFTGFEENER